MTVQIVKRTLAIVNLTVALASLPGDLDRTNIFVSSSQVKRATKLVQLANNN